MAQDQAQPSAIQLSVTAKPTGDALADSIGNYPGDTAAQSNAEKLAAVSASLEKSKTLLDAAVVLAGTAQDTPLFLQSVNLALKIWSGSSSQVEQAAFRLRPDLQREITALASAQRKPLNEPVPEASLSVPLAAGGVALAGAGALTYFLVKNKSSSNSPIPPSTPAPADPETGNPAEPEIPVQPVPENPVAPTPETPAQPVTPVPSPETPVVPEAPARIDPITKIPATIPYKTDPEAFNIRQFPDYANTPGIAQIGAQHAWARGNAGDNVLVAVVDDGLDLVNTEFMGRISQDAYDLVDNDKVPQAGGKHGTHVSGTIGAGLNQYGVVGVAPAAHLLPIRAFDDKGVAAGGEVTLARALDHARDHKALVVNNSWALSVPITAVSSEAALKFLPNLIPSIRKSVEAGQVLVFATGNDGFPDAGLVSGLPALFPDLIRGVIAVGAVDGKNAIADFSNRCGMAAQWCVVAPGVDILSTVPGGGYEKLSGTSMAAPHVSGAVALLIELFPNLTPQEAAEILLRTTHDLGEPGIDAVYGRGLIDLERASNPVGRLTLPAPTTPQTAAASPLVQNPQQQAFDLGATAFKATSPFGRSLSSVPLGVVVQDDYRRGYRFDLADRIVDKVGRSAKPASTERLKAYGLTESVIQISSDPSKSASLYLESGNKDVVARGGDHGLTGAGASVAMRSAVSQWEANFHHETRRLATSASVSALYPDMRTASVTKEGNPFLGLLDEGFGFSTGGPVSDSLSLGASAHYGETVNATTASAVTVDARWTLGPVRTLSHDGESRSAPFSIMASFGVVTENDSILGSVGTGALKSSGTANTIFISTAARLPLWSNIDLFGDFHLGRVDFTPAGDNLLGAVSGIVGAAGLGVAVKNLGLEGDRLSMSVSQPLRFESGKANFKLPGFQTGGLDIVRNNVSVNTEPGSREIDLKMTWTKDFDPENALSVGIEHRLNPNNDGSSSAETIAMVKFVRKF